MSSREKILQAIAGSKPQLLPLPVLPVSSAGKQAFADTQKFITILQGIGGTVVETDSLHELTNHLSGLMDNGLKVASLSSKVGTGNVSITERQTATDLESIHTAVIDGSIGVAENGAVWLNESKFVNRLVPFICQHLVIILDAAAIVPDMHEAYRSIRINQEGYGLFLAGPSKTADIEQSLVIGAHGARSTTVYLLQLT